MMLFKRLITTVLLMFALLLPTMAQQKADTTYTFRFMVEKDMFYVPWSGNDTELALQAESRTELVPVMPRRSVY